MNTKKYVQAENVEKIFETKRGRYTALKDINLSVRQGEFVSIIGHSGCGKSTLLNLIAGLELVTRGALFCAGREIAGPGPQRAMVFQNHSLLPWLTCFANVYLAVESVFGADEGLLVCPEGAACLSAARRLRADGWLREHDEVLVLNTGAGIKYPETALTGTDSFGC